MSKRLTVRGFPSSACMIKLLTTRPSMKISINSVFAIGIVYWPWSLRKRRKKIIRKEQTFVSHQLKFETLEYNTPSWLNVLEGRNILSLLLVIEPWQWINSIDSVLSVVHKRCNQRLNNCQMTVESKHVIAFVTIGDCQKYLTPSFQPMRTKTKTKTKTNRTLHVRFFPRFERVTSNCYEFDWFISLFTLLVSYLVNSTTHSRVCMYFACSLTPPRNYSRSLSFAQSRQKMHHTLPSFMCILGPNVLNILATRTSTCSCRYRFKTDENQWTLRQCYSENLFVKIKNIWRKKNFPNLFGVSVTHGLGDTFSFIVTRSRSNRIYMTPVLFALRMLLHETRSSWWHRKRRHSKANI